jgi:hypothetical protein
MKCKPKNLEISGIVFTGGLKEAHYFATSSIPLLVLFMETSISSSLLFIEVEICGRCVCVAAFFP